MKKTLFLSFIFFALANSLYAQLTPVKWDKPVDISEAQVDLQTYRLAVNSKGDLVVIWTEEKMIGPIQASTKSIGEAWQGPIKLSILNGMCPKVVIDEVGNITAVWVNQLPHGNILSATKSVGSPWEASPTALSHEFSLNPQIALAPQGGLYLMWGDKVSGRFFLRAKSVQKKWSLSEGFSFAHLSATIPLQLSFDKNGESIVLGTGIYDLLGNKRVPFVATQSGHTFWSEPYVLCVSDCVFSQLLETGEFVSIYQQESGTKCLVRSQEGIWETSDFFSITKASHLSMAANKKGDLVAVWRGINQGEIFSSTKLSGGSWSLPETVCILKRAVAHLEVVYDDEGCVLCLFQDSKNYRFLIVAKTPQEGWSRSFMFTMGFKEERPIIKRLFDEHLIIVWRDSESKHLFASTGIWNKHHPFRKKR